MTEVRACAELILTATIKSICICPYAAASWSGALRTDSLLTAAVFIWTGCFSGHRAARTVKHKIFTRRCDKLGDFHRMPLGVRVGRELTLHQHQCDLCVNWRLQCISQGKQQFSCWAITTADLKKKKECIFWGKKNCKDEERKMIVWWKTLSLIIYCMAPIYSGDLNN